MARRTHRGGRSVQAKRAGESPHAYVPHVRLFIDATSEPVLAARERTIFSDGMARRKPKAARMAGTIATDKRAIARFQ